MIENLGTKKDLNGIEYDPDDLAIITTHFNYAKFSRIRDTYYEWIGHIPHPVICYELVVDGEKEIDGSTVIYGNKNNILWQKERLINIAVSNLPERIKYVIWIDHDLIPTNKDWINNTIELLCYGYDAVQLFTEFQHFSVNNVYNFSFLGSVYGQHSEFDGDSHNPGGAWAAHRKLLDDINIYDRSICGGGDAIWLSGTTGIRRWYDRKYNDCFKKDIHDWYDKIPKLCVGYLENKMKHLWHGSIKNRLYGKRTDVIRDLGYNPKRDTFIDDQGLLSWTEYADKELIEFVKNYFVIRKQ